MYSYKRKSLPKNTVEFDITIPKADIDSESKKAFERLQQELATEGFRKGKVPKNIAEKHISKEMIYQEMIRILLGQVYDEILKKEDVKPIMSPKIELVKAKENEDWEIKITVAEKPTVELGNYKETVKKAKAEGKSADIWTPGKEPPKKDEEAERQQTLNRVLEALLKNVKFEISDLVIESELENRLSLLMDDIRKIGLTVDSYLKSKNLTIEELKERYRKEIVDTYKLEFILAEIADKEGIKVEQADLDKLFANIKDEKEKEQARQNSYMYATILRKQKALEYITSL